MQVLISLAAVALVLGVLVFVHELGHYSVAKWCGVRVEVFSLGFGKRLWGFRRGDTDYRLSLLPLGGYVKMSGENPMEERTGDPGEFTSHPRWQRFLIAIAGPVMNVILALLIFAFVYHFHHPYAPVERQPVNVFFVEHDSPAEKAGIKRGDKIIKIDGIQDPNWNQALIAFAMNAGQPVEVTVQRGNQILPMQVVPVKGADRAGEVGLIPPEVVGTLEANMPAAQAGVHVGDTLLSLAGTQVHNTDEVQKVFENTKDAPVQLVVWRDGEELALTVKPVLNTIPGQGTKYRIGFSAGAVERLPLGKAFRSALDECQSNSLLIFKLLGKMVQQPRNALDEVSGPIGITVISGQAARAGLWQYLWVMALISLNLAVFNLLPIPILDGGLMLMLAIEGILRRDIKQEIKERVYQVAFVCLVLFAAVVIYSDIVKTLPGHM